MPNLLNIEDINDVAKTRALEASDVNALRAVGDWIKSFVARPHPDLGRAGPVCPFVPGSLERKTLWLAPERAANGSGSDIVQLVGAYRKLFRVAPPISGEDTIYKSIVIVFSDLAGDRAGDLFPFVLQHQAIPAYEEDGLVIGGFFDRNKGSAIHNADFHPFRSPAPFLLMRQAALSDWKFFLDQSDWFDRWARRFEGAAVQALAEALRRQPWRDKRE